MLLVPVNPGSAAAMQTKPAVVKQKRVGGEFQMSRVKSYYGRLQTQTII